MSLQQPPVRQKNPKFVAAGKAGMRARWGPPRVLRLDQLSPLERRLIQALLDASREAASSEPPKAA